MLIKRDRLEPEEVTLVQGIPCVVPRRAVVDAMRWADGVREAVVAFDMAAAAGLVTLSGLTPYVGTLSRWNGIGQVRRALPHGSDRSRSPAESRLRLIWTLDAGLPDPLVNWPVADRDGRFLAEVDLLDPTDGLVGEYDGADHRTGSRHAKDVWREDRLRRVGLEVVTLTGRDLARPGLAVERIHAARGRARAVPPAAKTFLIKAVVKRAPRQPDRSD